MRISEKLRSLREAAGLSQDGLAAQAKVPAATIRGIEQGWGLPSWPTLRRLAEGLGASLGDFDGCEVEDEPPVRRGAGRKRKPAR